MKRIENHHETVVAMERSVSLFLVGEDVPRFAVIQGGAYIEIVAVIGDTNLSSLGGGRNLLRLSLQESVGWGDSIPIRRIEMAVESNALTVAECNRGDGSVWGGCVRLSPGPLDWKKKKEDR